MSHVQQRHIEFSLLVICANCGAEKVYTAKSRADELFFVGKETKCRCGAYWNGLQLKANIKGVDDAGEKA